MHQPTPNRQPLVVLDQNVLGGHGMMGYGLSGSAKVGRGADGQFARPAQGRVVHHVQHR